MCSSKSPKIVPDIPPLDERRIFIDDKQAVSDLTELLAGLLREQNPFGKRQTVLLAIGTDRSTGDSLGPLVGSRVTQLAPGLIPVYGTLDEPVHAVNLTDKLQQIQQNYSSSLIIAVDACLGQLQSVGSITVGKGPLYPGTGVHKKLPPVGEIFISGVVNIGGFLEHLVLQNTRLSMVMKMAECISKAVVAAAEQYSGHTAGTSGKSSNWDKKTVRWFRRKTITGAV
jgi:putative sporulation protein YyaC